LDRKNAALAEAYRCADDGTRSARATECSGHGPRPGFTRPWQCPRHRGGPLLPRL